MMHQHEGGIRVVGQNIGTILLEESLDLPFIIQASLVYRGPRDMLAGCNLSALQFLTCPAFRLRGFINLSTVVKPEGFCFLWKIGYVSIN